MVICFSFFHVSNNLVALPHIKQNPTVHENHTFQEEFPIGSRVFILKPASQTSKKLTALDKKLAPVYFLHQRRIPEH